MKMVFADTLYRVAIVRPKDQWQEPARRARASLGGVRLLTTDEVLAEFLNTFSGRGEHLRRQAAKMVREILENPNVTVVPQSRDSFLQGVHFYEQRAHRAYSLTDCISMKTMRSHAVSEVLTNDRHFADEGFTPLIGP